MGLQSHADIRQCKCNWVLLLLLLLSAEEGKEIKRESCVCVREREIERRKKICSQKQKGVLGKNGTVAVHMHSWGPRNKMPHPKYTRQMFGGE